MIAIKVTKEFDNSIMCFWKNLSYTASDFYFKDIKRRRQILSHIHHPNAIIIEYSNIR